MLTRQTGTGLWSIWPMILSFCVTELRVIDPHFISRTNRSKSRGSQKNDLRNWSPSTSLHLRRHSVDLILYKWPLSTSMKCVWKERKISGTLTLYESEKIWPCLLNGENVNFLYNPRLMNRSVTNVPGGLSSLSLSFRSRVVNTSHLFKDDREISQNRFFVEVLPNSFRWRRNERVFRENRVKRKLYKSFENLKS